jgi:hypothetical protein
MNSILLASASKVVPNDALLVNMMRLRVRQLLGGARPMLVLKPGLGLADIALSEIAAEKLVSERILAPALPVTPAAVITFPRIKPVGKAA